MPDCRTYIPSEDVYDFIIPFSYEQYRDEFPNNCILPIGLYDSVLYVNKNNAPELNYQNYVYNAIPSCYGLMDIDALTQSGIYQVQNQPYLNLRGQGVILGFVDTGIDYRNDVFRFNDGTTRIATLWDQSGTTGEAPDGFYYGTEYGRMQINVALQNEDPLQIVPQRDELGHGTKVAGIAAGNYVSEENFCGAAPEATLAVVKVKQAKQYLKRFYYIPDEVPAFQENDIILAIQYLVQYAQAQRTPIVICVGFGTSMGSHDGYGVLERYLQDISRVRNVCVVVPSGNEANTGHHFFSSLPQAGSYDEVEIRMEERLSGMQMELWTNTPNILSISLTSPGGETMPRVPPISMQGSEYTFIFEETKIRVDYQMAETRAGAQAVIIRFTNPTQGVWRMRVYGDVITEGGYHIWLPIYPFLSLNTYFLRSDPQTTFTCPAGARDTLAVGGYNGANGSSFIESGRGLTPSGRLRPLMVAPAVNIRTSSPGNRFVTVSGTSYAAAITAGAAALIFQWNEKRKGTPLDSASVIDYLIRGLLRVPNVTYPSPVEGLGRLNLEGTFESLRVF